MFLIPFMQVCLCFTADISCWPGGETWSFGSAYVAQTLKFDRSWGSASRVGKNESESVEKQKVTWFTSIAHAGTLKATVKKKWVDVELVYV